MTDEKDDQAEKPEIEGLEKESPSPVTDEDSARKFVDELAEDQDEGADSEDEGDESGDTSKGLELDEVLDKMPDELKPQFKAWLESQKAKPEADDFQDVMQLLAMSEAEKKKQETPKEPQRYVAKLPEPYADLEDFFTDFTNEHFKHVAELESKLQQLEQRTEQQLRYEQARALKTEFDGLRSRYPNYQELSPRVEQIIKSTPGLAETVEGLDFAFRMASMEKATAKIQVDRKAAQKGGAVPRTPSNRAAVKSAPAGLKEIKTIRDAARIAANRMKSQGMTFPDDEE